MWRESDPTGDISAGYSILNYFCGCSLFLLDLFLSTPTPTWMVSFSDKIHKTYLDLKFQLLWLFLTWDPKTFRN